MKKSKLIVTLACTSILFAGLVSCGSSTSKTDGGEFSYLLTLDSESQAVQVGKTAKIVALETNDGKEHSYSYESSDTSILTVSADGVVKGVKAGSAVVTATEATTSLVRKITISVYTNAASSGVATYSDSYEEKGHVLGALEEYGMEKNLTGISLFENGGYQMFSKRVTPGVNDYVVGFGFGTLSEGSIDETSSAVVDSDDKASWKSYYHSASASDPMSINDLDTEGSEISDLASYIGSSYWGTRLNAEKDNYEWYSSLALDDRPIPMTYTGGGTDPNDMLDSANWGDNSDKTASSQVWKIHVRTGDGITFRTNSKAKLYGTELSSFDGREVTIDDYLYAYKFLLTQSFGQYRGGELSKDTDFGIYGASKYYEATKDSAGVDEDAWKKNVGMWSGHDDIGDYICFIGTAVKAPFYAMYGYSSSLYRPLCQDFVKAIGNGDEKVGSSNLGNFIGTETSITPVDTILSLGAYTLEYWEKTKSIVFMKNDTWFENKISGMEDFYSIKGVRIKVYPGAASDDTLVFKEYLAGKLDAARIPNVSYLNTYRSSELTHPTKGDSVFKLNINSCTEESWEEKFGEDGSITQTDPADYWDVKPWMSNDFFLKGLNTCIDRKTFSDNRAVIPSNNYLSTNYMIDPEAGVSYDSTADHTNAIANFYPDSFGYSEDAALVYFRSAVAQLVEDGELLYGTKKHPTEISIDIWWMYESDITGYGDEIAGYIEKAFNDIYVSNGKVKLKVNNYAVTTWSDVYYSHLMVGQYDLGFGSISGNSLDPLNFLEVLRSDNSSGFTLNWGPDTSVVDEDLIYDDKPWSFDALWAAGNNYAIVEKGAESPVFSVNSAEITRLANGGLQLDLSVNEMNNADVQAALLAVCLYGTSNSDYTDYAEIYVYSDGTDDLSSGHSKWTKNADGTYTIIFAPEVVAYFANKETYPQLYALGIDLYVSQVITSLGISYTTVSQNSYFSSLRMSSIPAIPEA